MCVYCYIGTEFYKTYPWEPPGTPLYPMPTVPYTDPTSIELLRQILDALKEVKKAEEAIGCPCDPAEARGKPDFIADLEKRIAALEKKHG